MMDFLAIIDYFRDADNFVRVFILITLTMYNFYALALAFQIFTYNRLMTISSFAPVFRAVAILHVAFSFILLLIVVLSL